MTNTPRLWARAREHGIGAPGELRPQTRLSIEPERAARYQIMFGKTHSFLPSRNGLVPNTAHIALHIATAATLLALLVN